MTAAAALPVTMKSVEDNLGVAEEIPAFVLPQRRIDNGPAAR